MNLFFEISNAIIGKNKLILCNFILLGGFIMYETILKFNGTWRTYQERVLSRFYDYKIDGKVHIVAAPGSGKTTLGIELIRLFNQPCIILAPSITIREQWVTRIEEAFLLEGIKSEDVVSQDLKNMKLITVTTYQAIHSAMTNYKGKIIDEIDDEIKLEENVDYESFDLIQSTIEQNIKTICLDECHHLRNEWWKSLELFQKETALDYTIALTATPPYDSTPELWTRYMKVCGEIDEEISIPELVKDSNLCPHQDYVYFNYPTKDELSKIKVFKKNRDEYCRLLLKDDEFKNIVLSHVCLKKNADYDQLLENPSYLSSILIYLNATGCKVSSRFKEILGYTRLENPSPKWFELLLQGVLYSDCASYDIDEPTLKKYQHELKLRGLIEKRKVTLQLKQSLKKDLVSSVGKCESIRKITFNEYKSMGNELRLLILCDYIKKEYKTAIGNLHLDVHALGVIPFFELLRRENQKLKKDVKLGVLCGGVVIIPSSAKLRLLELVNEPSNITFKSFNNLSDLDYVEVEVRGNRHFLTGVITQLFEEGFMEVLIGTKSLLGEGWDSPCVNSLILASFVGSFMLSNQMRGRAIRSFSKDPDKCSNIWHLVCVLPQNIMQGFGNNEQGEHQVVNKDNQDMEMLTRRMENFLGLHYEIDSIESGIHRLNAIKYPIELKSNVTKTNEKMLKLSSNRKLLKKRWDESLVAMNKMEIVNEVCKDNKIIRILALFDYIRYLFLSLFTIILLLSFVTASIVLENNTIALFLYLFIVVGIYVFILNAGKLLKCLNPLILLKDICQGIRSALLYTNKFDSNEHRVEVINHGVFHFAYLIGGTGHDKSLFGQCLFEMFQDIDNQRYILYAASRKNKADGYYPIPDIFSKRKEDAELFASYMKKYIGKYKVVYTRNVEGRKILLKGRVHAMANKQNRAIQRKKVKSSLE